MSNNNNNNASLLIHDTINLVLNVFDDSLTIDERSDFKLKLKSNLDKIKMFVQKQQNNDQDDVVMDVSGELLTEKKMLLEKISEGNKTVRLLESELKKLEETLLILSAE